MTSAARISSIGGTLLRALALSVLLASVSGAQPADDPQGFNFDRRSSTSPRVKRSTSRCSPRSRRS